MLQYSKNLPDRVKVGQKHIGEGEPVFIVAEIGNNHNGEIELAKRLVEEAARAGADAVKFQKRCLSEVFIKEMLGKPQTSSRALGRTYGEYRNKLELSDEKLVVLKDLAHSLGLVFFVTPFDLKSAETLDQIGMDAWKISSFDLTHLQLVEYIAQKKQPIFLSTGMASLEEMDKTVEAILKYNEQLILNHCVSIYPTPDEELNLGAIAAMAEHYSPLPIGYSGHEMGFIPTLASVVLGAKTVERHFTMDKTLPGPDHATVSLDLPEFAEMVRQIRRLERAVLDKNIYLHEREIPHRHKHGKSLVARVPIPAGTVISAQMLCCKSPGHGLKPEMFNEIIGKTAQVDIPEDTVIEYNFINW